MMMMMMMIKMMIMMIMMIMIMIMMRMRLILIIEKKSEKWKRKYTTSSTLLFSSCQCYIFPHILYIRLNSVDFLVSNLSPHSTKQNHIHACLGMFLHIHNNYRRSCFLKGST